MKIKFNQFIDDEIDIFVKNDNVYITRDSISFMNKNITFYSNGAISPINVIDGFVSTKNWMSFNPNNGGI